MSTDPRHMATLDYVRAHACRIEGLCARCGVFDVSVEWLSEHLGSDFLVRNLDLCAVACPKCNGSETRMRVQTWQEPGRSRGVVSAVRQLEPPLPVPPQPADPTTALAIAGSAREAARPGAPPTSR
jgi:hypothetical protein